MLEAMHEKLGMKTGLHALLQLGRSSPSELVPTSENNSCRKAMGKMRPLLRSIPPRNTAWLPVTHFMEGLSLQGDWQGEDGRVCHMRSGTREDRGLCSLCRGI